MKGRVKIKQDPTIGIILSLKAPSKIIVNNIQNFYFFKKTRLCISFESSVRLMIHSHEISSLIFSEKCKKKKKKRKKIKEKEKRKSKILSAANVFSTLRVSKHRG